MDETLIVGTDNNNIFSVNYGAEKSNSEEGSRFDQLVLPFHSDKVHLLLILFDYLLDYWYGFMYQKKFSSYL